MPEPNAPPDPLLVDDASGLERLAAELSRAPAVALDTESNSFHVYRERVCLLQLSTPEGDWIVDPLAVDVRPLGEVLCDGRETVLHGADYDVRCLRREYGWRFPRLFGQVAEAGTDICTMRMEYLKLLYEHPFTDKRLQVFDETWHKAFGTDTWPTK